MADPGGGLRPPLVSEIDGASTAVPADAGLLPGAPHQQDTKQSQGAAPQVSSAAWTQHRSTTDLNSYYYLSLL